MRLVPGIFVGIVGKGDLPFQWSCQLQEQNKFGIAAGHLCHKVQIAYLKVNPKQRKAELKDREKERDEKEETGGFCRTDGFQEERNLGLTLQLEKSFPKKRDCIVGRGIGARGSPRKDFLAPK